jgi:hypothetical protein
MSDPAQFKGTPKQMEFLLAFAGMVCSWNSAEQRLRKFLESFCGGGLQTMNNPYPGPSILVFELGSVGLANGLRTFANESLKGPQAEAVIHAVNFYERLREHRNYYVHGILFVVDLEGRVGGLIDYRTAKGSVSWFNDLVSIEKIRQTAEWCVQLTNFVNSLDFAMFFPLHASQIPWPDKPPLPDRLEKPRITLRGQAPQP